MLVYLGALFVLGWLGWWIPFWGLIAFTILMWTIRGIWETCEYASKAMKRLINLDPRGWWAFIIGAEVDYVEWFLAPEELKKAFDAERRKA